VPRKRLLSNHVMKHKAVADDIAKRISSGEFTIGRPIPPLRTLAKSYGVAVMTVHQATKVLIAEGVIDAKPHHRPLARLGLSLEKVLHQSIGIVLSQNMTAIWKDPIWRGALYRGVMDGIQNTSETIVTLHGREWRRDFPAGLVHLPLKGLILLTCPFERALFAQYKFLNERFPVVSVDNYTEHVHSVILDNFEITRDATLRLIALGHRRIAFIRPFLTSWKSRCIDPDAQQRADGFTAACAEAGLPPEQGVVFSAAFERNRASIRQIVRSGFTAVIAINTFHAQQTEDEARKAGLHTPRDLSIIAFGGSLPSRWTGPVTDFATLGCKSIELIRSRPRTLQCIRMPAKWNAGETIGPPRIRLG
jgi:DNA-binding LacI/PurR family transcriptional regulator